MVTYGNLELTGEGHVCWMLLIPRVMQQFLQGFAKRRQLKHESFVLEPSRDDVATIECKFRIGAQQKAGTEANHPRESRKPYRHADGTAQFAHELHLGYRMGAEAI